MHSRRDFIKLTGLAGTSMLVPSIFNLPLGNDFEGNRLIVLQLSGGNDWLNTVIPQGNDAYYRSRPNLFIPERDVIRLNDELGFHPALKPLKALFDEGELVIFNGVGYPEPNRSHFRSMDIWHTATDGRTYGEEGWLGQWARSENREFPAIELSSGLSLAMKANRGKALAMENLNNIHRIADDRILRAVAASAHDHSSHMASYLYQTAIRVCEGADYLTEKLKVRPSRENYPDHPLGADLKTIASLIIAGAETQVYYASLPGFDTHARQANQHERLLKGLSTSLVAFRNDLQSKGIWKNTLMMVFSEFGRRVAENAGGGTDHGTAGNVWLLGGGLKSPGIRGKTPSLVDLDDGDLIYHTDFRGIYAGILENWLMADSVSVLNGKFSAVQL